MITVTMSMDELRTLLERTARYAVMGVDVPAYDTRVNQEIAEAAYRAVLNEFLRSMRRN